MKFAYRGTFHSLTVAEGGVIDALFARAVERLVRCRWLGYPVAHTLPIVKVAQLVVIQWFALGRCGGDEQAIALPAFRVGQLVLLQALTRTGLKTSREQRLGTCFKDPAEQFQGGVEEPHVR